MKLQRAMHHRCMLIALPAVKQPGKICVEALVVTHHTRFQIIKPCENRCQDDKTEQQDFIGDARKGGMDRSFKPVLIFCGHKSLSTRNA